MGTEYRMKIVDEKFKALNDSGFYEKVEGLHIVMLTRFGSHLYGTNHPESDQDFKGIYIPSRDDMLLGKIEHTLHYDSKKDTSLKNSSDDIDVELISLQKFIRDACEGQTYAIDMLYTNADNLVYSGAIWDNIVRYREEFHTKNMESFVGYARKQAAKYGIKGSRLSDMKKVLDFIDICDNGVGNSTILKLKDTWDSLPDGEHIHKVDPQIDDKNQYKMYEVCGQKFQETAKLEYVRDGIQKKYNEYGARAKQAEANEGVDWKAISHAMRAAYQVIEILLYGDIKFPLRTATLLLNVKQGKLNYLREAAPHLEHLMETVEALSKSSTLPEKANINFWEVQLIKILTDFYFKGIK